MSILSEYENEERTDIWAFDVSQAVYTTDPNECGMEVRSYELLAWSLNFSYKLHDGHHFWARNNYSDVSLLTEDCFRYWNERRKTAVNPGIRMRYSELVREFKSQFPGVEIEGSFFTDSVKLLFDVLTGNYIADKETAEWYMFLFSIIGNNKVYLERAKELLLAYVTDCPEDSDKDERLQTEITIINDNWKSFSDQEKQAAEDRYAALLAKYEHETNDWHFFDALNPILYYCKKSGRKDDVHGYILRSEQLFRNKEYKGMQRQNIVRKLQDLYKRYQFVEDAIRLNKDIQEAGKEAISTMEHFSYSIDVPNEKIEAYVDSIIPEDVSLQIPSFIYHFISKEKATKEAMRREERSLLSMVATHYYDAAGHPTSVVGSLEDDPDGHYMQYLSRSNGLQAFFMERCIQRMKESGVWTCENIANMVVQCPILTFDSVKFLRKIIDHYFKEDFGEFCYMVIPQIEYIIRHVVEEDEGIVIKEHKNREGYQLKTLDELLRDPLIDRIYNIGTNDDSVSLYLRFLLTNDKGMNLRNRMCHGVDEPSKFEEKGVAHQLMHVLLLLTNIKINN